MKIEQITTSSMLSQLAIILKNDIHVLEQLLGDTKDNQEKYDLLDTLAYSKKKVLSGISLTGSAGNDGVPSTPNRKTALGYSSDDFAEINHQFELLDLLLKVEGEEKDMIKSASAEKGLPSEIKDEITYCLASYQKIIEQLKRSKSTQQLGTIEID